MTEQEAKEWIANDTSPMKIHIAEMKHENPMEYINSAIEVAIKALEEVQQYRALGTVEELKEAMEKPKAKMPKGYDLCTCPNCDTYNEVIKKRRNTVEHDIVYCWNCGQTLEI